MFKLLFLTLLCGAAYAAFTVPYHGHTVADRVAARAKYYLEDDSGRHPDHPGRKVANGQAARKDTTKAPAATDRAPAAPPARSRSSEEITRADRQALDQLIPR